MVVSVVCVVVWVVVGLRFCVGLDVGGGVLLVCWLVFGFIVFLFVVGDGMLLLLVVLLFLLGFGLVVSVVR